MSDAFSSCSHDHVESRSEQTKDGYEKEENEESEDNVGKEVYCQRVMDEDEQERDYSNDESNIKVGCGIDWAGISSWKLVTHATEDDSLRGNNSHEINHCPPSITTQKGEMVEDPSTTYKEGCVEVFQSSQQRTDRCGIDWASISSWKLCDQRMTERETTESLETRDSLKGTSTLESLETTDSSNDTSTCSNSNIIHNNLYPGACSNSVTLTSISTKKPNVIGLEMRATGPVPRSDDIDKYFSTVSLNAHHV